jgi:hypothetical protein
VTKGEEGHPERRDLTGVDHKMDSFCSEKETLAMSISKMKFDCTKTTQTTHEKDRPLNMGNDIPIRKVKKESEHACLNRLDRWNQIQAEKAAKKAATN